ncbi:hypothetical protein MHU86_18475 [Fragilaria crotonensis]|nr:hypothetical protein MHU86_18475 [Fragilaria crotonensis]
MTVSRKFGVPATVTDMNATTLQHAEYRVRTELGLSTSGYRHSPTHPIYGTAQGSANSPAIWCFLSSTLFDCYDSLAQKAHYYDTEGTTTVELGMVGFVDDCNGQTNAFRDDVTEHTVPQLIKQTQANAQGWTDMLNASGGALELSKCSCHILQWQFSAQGAPVLVPKISNDIAQVKVLETDGGKEQNLQILGAFHAH